MRKEQLIRMKSSAKPVLPNALAIPKVSKSNENTWPMLQYLYLNQYNNENL